MATLGYKKATVFNIKNLYLNGIFKSSLFWVIGLNAGFDKNLNFSVTRE